MSNIIDEPVTLLRLRFVALTEGGPVIAIADTSPAAREAARRELERKVASDADELGVRR